MREPVRTMSEATYDLETAKSRYGSLEALDEECKANNMNLEIRVVRPRHRFKDNRPKKGPSDDDAGILQN